MKNEIHFALYSIKKNIQNNAELRSSFLINIIGMMMNNISFIIIWLYFIQSVGVIGGWTSAEVIGLQGFTSLCYGMVIAVALGINKIPEYINNGTFDTYMLSPKNLLVRVASSAFSTSAIGDFLFGIIGIVLYGYMIQIDIIQVGIILVFAMSTCILFLAIYILVYSLSFYFVDARIITDGIFGLFFTPSLFHGGSFQGVMRFIFTFIIPSLLIGSIPVEIVRDSSLSGLFYVLLISLLWFFISIKFFYKAVKRYESSNFMTFGS